MAPTIHNISHGAHYTQYITWRPLYQIYHMAPTIPNISHGAHYTQYITWRPLFERWQTVIGQRSAGNGPNGLSYDYYYYYYYYYTQYITWRPLYPIYYIWRSLHASYYNAQCHVMQYGDEIGSHVSHGTD